MFIKMKRSFLILNMAMITVLMLISFAFVFMSVRNDVLMKIRSDLFSIQNSYKNYLLNPVDTMYPAKSRNGTNFNNTFFFITDISNGIKIQYNNGGGNDDDGLRNTLTTISNQYKNNYGIFKYGQKSYAYTRTTYDFGSTRLIVVDVSHKISVIEDMFFNMLLIGFIMMIFIFLISNFFTNRSIRPIEDAFIKQRQFISDASHELKTPLAVMKTNLDILCSNQDTKISDQSKWLNYTQNEIVGMANLINQLLVLTKVEQVKEIDTFSKINFSDILNSTLLSMEVIAFEKNIVINDTIDDDIYCLGNYDEIKRLTMILIDNAIKYCNDGGNIDVILICDNNTGSLVVKNTGVIIDAKECNSVFQRFYRGNQERERMSGSYGLGLSIAKATCIKHNMNIQAYPENDKSVFKVNFKVSKSDDKSGK